MTRTPDPAPLGPLRCAPAARVRGDAVWGTAAPARRWLLLEHPGPWHRLALQSPGISPSDADTLSALTRRSSTRTVVVRRRGRDAGGRGPGRSTARRRWILLDVVGRRQVAGTWSEAEGLAAPIAAVRSWPASDQPATATTLVCTHGVHDACCAIWGRPVVEALEAAGEDVWECSHLGGDRFAASAVVLPEGACYGNLNRDNAADVLAAHRNRAAPAAYLRGLSALPAPAQAAVAAVLQRHGPGGVDDVVAGPVVAGGEDQWTVSLTGTAPLPARLVATVRRTWGDPALLTCGASRVARPFTYAVELADQPEA